MRWGQSSSDSRRTVVKSLCQTIDEVLRELIPEGAQCALLDFPTYDNVSLMTIMER